MQSPCMNCSIRELGCHSKCKNYEGFKKAIEDRAEAKRKENVFYSFARSAKPKNVFKNFKKSSFD